MDFVAIDVETANADMSSICQVGVVRYSAGAIAEEWVTLVDPEDYFDFINVSIHGIDETTVSGAPTFPAIADSLHRFLNGAVAVCHTHFDRCSLHQAFSRYRLEPCVPTWLDSACVARRAWEQFARSGYGLPNVCRELGYDFRPHDALEDAKAAAHVLMEAIRKSGHNLEGWLKRVRQPIAGRSRGSEQSVKRDGNPDGPLYGEEIVFTGKLSITKNEAADLAAVAGCDVGRDVTKRTTILVVGDQDVRKLAGHDKSTKHRKAEDLIGKGQSIRILRETDFCKIIDLAEDYSDSASSSP